MVNSVVHDTSVDEVNVVAVDTSLSRSCAGKKNQGKVPKRIHKAEREKLKREQLNELFLDLANALELDEDNNGKASILNEATRLLKSISGQVECLRMVNAKLLSESHYVTMEKNELKDEKSALEAQIEQLQSEVEAKAVQSRPDLYTYTPPSVVHQQHLPADHLRSLVLDHTSQQVPLTGPVFVVPIGSDLPTYQEPDINQLTSKPASHVSKPQPRYPNSDSWPFRFVGELCNSGEQGHARGE